MRKNTVFLIMMLALILLIGCGQTENIPTGNTPQEILTDAEAESKPGATVKTATTPRPEPTSQSEPETETRPETEPELESKPEVMSLPQPQADGTGLSFALPDGWNKYSAKALQDLQNMIDYSGNRTLYGIIHGFMESQEISAISLVDSSVEDYDNVIYYYTTYDVALDDGTPLRLKIVITGWGSEEDGDEILLFNLVDVYPAFEDYCWSLGLENVESGDDWVYEMIRGNPTRCYSISEDSLQDYTWSDDYGDYYDDYYENPEATYTPEEPVRLTQYEWPDYCDEMDCLMMEAVGLQYNKTWGTATRLLKGGGIITISVLPQIGGGVEYKANVRVDNLLTIPVRSSDGINYQCKSVGVSVVI